MLLTRKSAAPQESDITIFFQHDLDFFEKYSGKKENVRLQGEVFVNFMLSFVF
jgi:hypothetical protein